MAIENGTYLAQLFDPQVVGDKIATDYGKFITVSNFFNTETNLVGNPGDTLTRNQYEYIGDANVLAEGEDDTPAKLATKQINVKVEKVSKQVILTDEAVLSGSDDPYGEATTQIAQAIAFKDDADAVKALQTTTLTATGTTLASAIVAGRKALKERGMKLTNYIFCNTADYFDMIADYAHWLPASEIAANLQLQGVLGQYFGVNVVTTDTVAIGKPILMLEGAGRKEMKRQFLAEQDRDLSNYSTLLAGSEHRVYYLYDAKGAVNLTVGTGA